MREQREELRGELKAVAAARRELSQQDEEFLLESFLARVERQIDTRIEARLTADPRTVVRQRATPRTVLGPLVLLAGPIPLAYFPAHVFWGDFGWQGPATVLCLVMWVVIVAVAVTWRVAEWHFKGATRTQRNS